MKWVLIILGIVVLTALAELLTSFDIGFLTSIEWVFSSEGFFINF